MWQIFICALPITPNAVSHFDQLDKTNDEHSSHLRYVQEVGIHLICALDIDDKPGCFCSHSCLALRMIASQLAGDVSFCERITGDLRR